MTMQAWRETFAPETAHVECPTCKGHSVIRFAIGHRSGDPQLETEYERDCPACNGKGSIQRDRYEAGEYPDLTERQAEEQLRREFEED